MKKLIIILTVALAAFGAYANHGNGCRSANCGSYDNHHFNPAPWFGRSGHLNPPVLDGNCVHHTTVVYHEHEPLEPTSYVWTGPGYYDGRYYGTYGKWHNVYHGVSKVGAEIKIGPIEISAGVRTEPARVEPVRITVEPAPAPVVVTREVRTLTRQWVEGHYINYNNGRAWVPGHWEYR